MKKVRKQIDYKNAYLIKTTQYEHNRDEDWDESERVKTRRTFTLFFYFG
jgi:hypothetical protein